MATLAGSTIASTYTYLLKMDGTSGITSSLVAIQDGDATSSSLKISTSKVEVIPASDSTALFEVSQADGTAVLSVDTSNARVGIGIASPAQPLHVVKSDLTNIDSQIIRIDNTGTGSTLAGTGAGLTFLVGDTNAGPSNVGFIWGQQTGEGGTWEADASLNFRSGHVAPTTTNAHMTILPTGNVGI